MLDFGGGTKVEARKNLEGREGGREGECGGDWRGVQMALFPNSRNNRVFAATKKKRSWNACLIRLFNENNQL